MRILMTTALLLVLTTSVTACNTMSGAGQDLQDGGKKLENSADKNK